MQWEFCSIRHQIGTDIRLFVTEFKTLITVGNSMELHHTYFIFQHGIQLQKDIGQSLGFHRYCSH